MCVSSAPANFMGTTLFLGKKYHPIHGPVFVLGYQNTAQNLSSGPNAMLLHIPTQQLEQKNFLVTTGCKHILQDMVDAVKPRMRGGSRSFGMPKAAALVFDYDIYTVVAANNARSILMSLDRVPAHKRPLINTDLIDFYDRFYPGHAFALCCFDNSQAVEAAPILIWYKPTNPDLFECPSIDAHTGYPPDLRALVDVDAWVILGHDHLQRGVAVNYTDTIPATIQDFLPDKVVGKYFYGSMKNGDFGIQSHNLLGSGDVMQHVSRLVPYGAR